jgi:hypothetical protein
MNPKSETTLGVVIVGVFHRFSDADLRVMSLACYIAVLCAHGPWLAAVAVRGHAALK